MIRRLQLAFATTPTKRNTMNRLINPKNNPQRSRFLILVLLIFVLLNISTAPFASSCCSQELAESAVVQDGVTEVPALGTPSAEFQGMPYFDNDLYKMIVRFAINLIFLILIVALSYCSHQKSNSRYVFNFVIMNIVVFFICFTLKKLQMELGMALGLFAIFTILRYRTDQINVKDMTYLFVVIGLAVINSLSNRKSSYAELLFANSAIFVATLILEKALATAPKAPKLASREIVYDNLELLKPDREGDLKADLLKRTGIEAKRVDVKKIDLKQGCATIAIRYSK